MAAASLPHPLRLATAPDKTDVGMECCRRRMNLNILSSGGSNPSLSANVTIPNPAGGTKTNLPNIIAAVVFNPNFELPGPSVRLPPNANNMQGIIASPRIKQLSVKK